MYQKLKQMYELGRINEAYLIQAVKLGWITEEQKNEILGINKDVEEKTEEEIVEEYKPTVLPELE